MSTTNHYATTPSKRARKNRSRTDTVGGRRQHGVFIVKWSYLWAICAADIFRQFSEKSSHVLRLVMLK